MPVLMLDLGTVTLASFPGEMLVRRGLRGRRRVGVDAGVDEHLAGVGLGFLSWTKEGGVSRAREK